MTVHQIPIIDSDVLTKQTDIFICHDNASWLRHYSGVRLWPRNCLTFSESEIQELYNCQWNRLKFKIEVKVNLHIYETK